MTRLVIVGAGGHAAVVAEAARLQGEWDDICFIDQQYPDVSQVIGLPVVGNMTFVASLQADDVEFIVGIGDNDTRLKVHEELSSDGAGFAVVVHPSASVSRSASVQSGTVIMAQAVVNARSTVGVACIINTGATVDHDCQLGSAVHLSPGVNIAGGVSVGTKTWIGIGAVVVNKVSIGDGVIVGAGAAVLDNVPAHQTVVGVPAREINR